MNLHMPEYYWAQGFIVASHSLRYVYCGNPSCDSMSSAAAAEQLDATRRTHNLTMILSSDYYMANCRFFCTRSMFLDQQQLLAGSAMSMVNLS
jgi:hypothetical protein